jgi:hypothetical protein
VILCGGKAANKSETRFCDARFAASGPALDPVWCMPMTTDVSRNTTPIPRTDDQGRPIRALSLLSGGLDSQLAICVLKAQGIDVHAVAFESPFFNATKSRAAAAHLGVPIHVIDFTADIVSLVKSPKHGFGGYMNPCIDCHARMIRRTGELMEREGFHFISTGEVLNQRPMSQNRRSLGIVTCESGYEGWVLRPMSAQFLPETEPEKRGWVERSRLLDIEGRGRRRQLDLAAVYGLKDVPMPAGGCKLTEPNFSRRVKDLRDHEGLDDRRAIEQLKVGRHFRLASGLKVIIGRDEKDNAALEAGAGPSDVLFQPQAVPGPTGLLPGTAGEDEIREGATICATYCDAAPGQPVAIGIRSGPDVRVLHVVPPARDAFRDKMV